MLKKTLTVFFCLTSVYCFPQEVPIIRGAVAKPGILDAKAVKGLNRYHRLVKVADPKGNFLCSQEVGGIALRDVLERKGIKKQTDGFDRLLDTFIAAKGEYGRRVLFSYGEVFLAGDEGPLLVDSARMILTHHHPPLNAGKNDPTLMLDIKKRNSINLDGCVSCHEGPRPPRLYLPKGWLLIAAQDRFPGRFLESLTEIAIGQVGIEAVDTRAAGGRDSLVEAPVIVGPDGRSHPFDKTIIQSLQRQSVTGAGIGQGTGYRGISTWEGVPLKGLLERLVPNGIEPRDTYVVVTAADGYRCVYSDGEVFNGSAEKCVLIIDRRGGKP